MKTQVRKFEEKVWEEFLDALEDNCENAFELDDYGSYSYVKEPFASYSVDEQLDYLGYSDIDNFAMENV